ncbi:MAG: EamA family transporter [Spirochaetia bacterium]|nr:EamA family transporter [Spirochaetia bacterium]
MKAFWLAVLTAILWGISPLLEKIGLSRGISPMTAVVIRNFGSMSAALVLWAFLARNPEYAKNFHWDSAALLMISAAVSAVVGQALYYSALQSGEMSKVVPIAGAFPVVAFILGVIFMGETVTATKIAGVGLVVGGIILLK